jgi:hypothetical protein
VRAHQSAIALACLSHCLAIQGDSYADDLGPCPLPPAARARIEDLAASSTMLILGEVHGTREVPELVESLLAPLTELGYGTLALEVPHKDQAPLLAWARGETDRIPDFFANPNGDGRANAQLLTLVRIAVSPPYRWRIICFDDPESVLERWRQAPTREEQAGGPDGPPPTADEVAAIWRERDAAMASNVLKETRSLRPTSKILAICGNLHARTTNDVQEPMLSKLWPSFAGVLKQRQPAWRINSVNIEFCRGAFFNDGKAQPIGGQPPEPAVDPPAGQTGWNLVLSLPVASPATFHSP